MNLATTLEIKFGGPGSGCQGPNCGRPSSGGSNPDERQAATFKEAEGIKMSKGLREEIEHQINVTFENPDFLQDELHKLSNRQIIKIALRDTIDMGRDFGGAYHGIRKGHPEYSESQQWARIYREANKLYDDIGVELPEGYE